MPEIEQIPEPNYVNLEEVPFRFRDEEIDAEYAVNLVERAFMDCENWRAQNMEPAWNESDKLYYGWVRQRFWKGTNQKRSSIPIRVALDYLESAYPEILSSLFVEDPHWFEVLPDLGTTIQQALHKQERLAYVLEQQGDVSGKNGVVELKRALRSTCHYANGYVEVQYDPIKRIPFVQWLNIRDVYLPANTGNFVDDAPYWIKRTWMTVQELDDLRDAPDMNIPSREQLAFLARNKQTAMADSEKDALAGLLNRQFNFHERRPDPTQQEIEVLIYQSKDRIIWVLNRKWIAYNGKNTWGFFGLCGAPYSLVLDQQAGEGVPDLVKPEQKLQQGITNAAVDELSLNLNPPRNALASALSHPTKLHIHPGALFKSSTPDKDLVPQIIGNPSGAAFAFIQDSNMRLQKRLGISEIVQSGLPTPSNANRTATGINSQSSATSRRLFTAISNFEDFLLVPMLLKIDRMLASQESDIPNVAGRNKEGRGSMVPGASMGAPVTIRIRASSKAQARSRLAQASQILLQYLFNPQLVGMAQKQGKVLDFSEVDRFVNEALGTAHRYEFWRTATPEELKIMSQPDPNTQAQIQEKEADRKVRTDIATIKAEADLQSENIKATADLQVMAEKVALAVIEMLREDKNMLAGLLEKESDEKSGGKKKQSAK